MAGRKLRQFSVGDAVMVRNYCGGEKWKHGTVTEILGSRHYMVELTDTGYVWKRHVDQLLECRVDPVDRQDEQKIPEETVADTFLPSPSSPLSHDYGIPNPDTEVEVDCSNELATSSSSLMEAKSPDKPEVSEAANINSGSTVAVERRYPVRQNRAPPSYLIKDYST